MTLAVVVKTQGRRGEVAVELPSVRLVVAADKLDNARSLLREYRVRGESLWNFFHGGREGTLWYYDAMLAALKGTELTALVEEVERTLREIRGIADQGREI